MRNPFLLLLVPAVLACGKSDEPAHSADSPAAAQAQAPAALKAGDISGTWTGMTMVADGDSVTSRWTLATRSDSTGHLIREATKDTVPFRVRFQGDSMIAVSEPFRTTTAANAPRLIFTSIGRLQNGKLVGTVSYTTPEKTDSIVNRARWEASRAS